MSRGATCKQGDGSHLPSSDSSGKITANNRKHVRLGETRIAAPRSGVNTTVTKINNLTVNIPASVKNKHQVYNCKLACKRTHEKIIVG